MVCHRCGKPGHFASQCKASSSSTTPTLAKKRTLEESDLLLTGTVLLENDLAQTNDQVPKIVMACENVTPHENVMTLENDLVPIEFYDCEEFFECEDAYSSSDVLVAEHEWLVPPEMAIQDQGASSFLIGTEYILRYLAWLQLLGFDLSKLEFKKRSKHIKFGGDANGHARWLLSVPTYINGKAGFIQAYIIFGATPPLLGRPVMERLQAVVDFGAYKMQILGSDWLPIEKGRQNTMLMRLARKEAGPMQFNNHQFDLRTEDDHHEILRIDDFIEDMKAQSRFNNIKGTWKRPSSPPRSLRLKTWNYLPKKVKRKRIRSHFVVSGIWCLSKSARKKNGYNVKSYMPTITNLNDNQWCGKSMLDVAMSPENVNDLVQRSDALDLKMVGTSTKQPIAVPSCSSLMKKSPTKCG